MKLHKLFTAILILLYTSIYAQVDVAKIKESTDAFSKKHADVGTIILVEKQGELINYATGFSNKEKGKKAKTKNLFEIGSASKMVTAIAVLQLVEKGKLSLNTPINKFFPDGKIKNLANFKGKNYWDKVTVEMLLNHTSGFIDYLNVYGDDEKALKMFSVRGKVYSSEEIYNLAVNHGDANFIPGEKFKYCNTGYIILGDIISRLSGMNWRDYIQKNIFDKVGMKNTYFGSRLTKKAKRRMMRGHYKGKPSFMPPTLAGSAGEIVSCTKDLEKFLLAWHGGKLYLRPETLQMQQTKGFHQMYEDYKVLTYGYGVMQVAGFYGHGGQTFGFQSYVVYNPTKKIAYVIGVNDATVSPMSLFFLLENISFF